MKPASTNTQTIALHRLEIASPCTASWDRMQGDSRVRHCGDCNKNVFNLSAMPEAEAAALLANNTDGALCVRFYRRKDGTVMTSDCGTSARAILGKAWRKLPGMAGASLLALSAAGCVEHEPQPTMGPPPVPEATSEATVTIAPPRLMGKPKSRDTSVAQTRPAIKKSNA